MAKDDVGGLALIIIALLALGMGKATPAKPAPAPSPLPGTPPAQLQQIGVSGITLVVT